MDNKIKIDLSATDISETTDGKRNSQARDWCFTINNPVQTEQEFLSYLQSVPDLRYVVFQREKAPETGTEHYQGYFEFTQPKWFTTIKKYLSKEHIGVDAHIEARRGKRSQAREYCMDEETRISPQYYEYGEFIEDGERTDLTDIMHDIENGMSFYDLSKKHGNRFIRVMKWAKEYRQSHLENKFKRVFRNMKVYYIYGSAGCGKTSYVFQKHGYDDVYRTTNYEFGWIDDYNGEKILFLDELFNFLILDEMENTYTKWVLENCLYLNPLNSIELSGEAMQDKLNDMYWNLDKEQTALIIQLFENYLYYREKIYKNRKLKNDNELRECISTFKDIFSLFDQVAFFLHRYFDLDIEDKKVSYLRIFNGDTKCKNGNRLLDIHNTNLFALYWIKREYRTENDDLKMHNYV